MWILFWTWTNTIRYYAYWDELISSGFFNLNRNLVIKQKLKDLERFEFIQVGNKTIITEYLNFFNET